MMLCIHIKGTDERILSMLYFTMNLTLTYKIRLLETPPQDEIVNEKEAAL